MQKEKVIIRECPLETLELKYVIEDCLSNNNICYDKEEYRQSDFDCDIERKLDIIISKLREVDFFDESIRDCKKEINIHNRNITSYIAKIVKGDNRYETLSMIPYIEKKLYFSERCIESLITDFADAVDSSQKFINEYTKLRYENNIEPINKSKLMLFLLLLGKYNIRHIFKPIVLIDNITLEIFKDIEIDGYKYTHDDYKSFTEEMNFLYNIWKEHLILDTIDDNDLLIKDIGNIILKY